MSSIAFTLFETENSQKKPAKTNKTKSILLLFKILTYKARTKQTKNTNKWRNAFNKGNKAV